ncbi:Retrovirus-related Pol polyprotein from transposon TNT 1-94 [Linum grandiflorum]
MGNESTAPIMRRGSVALELSSGKILRVSDVLHVPKIRKNLVSGSILNRYGYKQVYEYDRYVLSKGGVFVGFGYYNNGMFMLNINNTINISAFMVGSSEFSLWHARLGHVNYKRLTKMSKEGLLPAFDIDNERYKTCMLTKITDATFYGHKQVSLLFRRFLSLCFYSDLVNTIKANKGCFGF